MPNRMLTVTEGDIECANTWRRVCAIAARGPFIRLLLQSASPTALGWRLRF